MLIAALGPVKVQAEPDACWVRVSGAGALHDRRDWPGLALAATRGLATAIEIEQLIELGLAEPTGSNVRIPYEAFAEMDRVGVGFGSAWTPFSPLHLRIDRSGDLGRPDFEYRYQFLDANRPVHVVRRGCFIQFGGLEAPYRLEPDVFRLVDVMDRFNEQPAAERKELGWPTFAEVKGLSRGTGASLDEALLANEVLVPSVIGLTVRDRGEHVTLEPTCEGLPSEALARAFERNRAVQRVYNVDLPGGRRMRVVLGPKQQEVLRRMKRAGRLQGPLADQARSEPGSFFEGVADEVEYDSPPAPPALDPTPPVEYGPRVAGVGEFEFASIPKAVGGPSAVAELFRGAGGEAGAGGPVERPMTLVALAPDGTDVDVPVPDEAKRQALRAQVADALAAGRETVNVDGIDVQVSADLLAALDRQPDGPRPRPSKGDRYLLIYTDETTVRERDLAEVAQAITSAGSLDDAPSLPAALLSQDVLKPHQVDGLAWLDRCARQPGRRGALLADDMGMGKTFQILMFVARAIESGLYPDLSRDTPPWRPVLIIVPLILLENETWQNEMERFFGAGGAIFQPVLAVHGVTLRSLRRDSAGKETQVGAPLLDIDALRRNRVVITTYDTVKNYQHSFAQMVHGHSLWSVVVTDEAQEYKTPSSKISHALKALHPSFHIASTGTPVENRLLDLWNVMDTLQPALLGAAKEFTASYESPKPGAAPPLAALREKLHYGEPSAFLLRRDKSHAVGLPSKKEHRLLCNMTPRERALHEDIVSSRAGDNAGQHILGALNRLSLLYQHPRLLEKGDEGAPSATWVDESPKLQAVVETLKTIKERGEKAIVFARHIRAQQMLSMVFEGAFAIPVRIINGSTARGGTATESRKKVLTEFRERDGFGVVVLSPFVAGVGLTITEANHVIHYGRWWNPAVENQATDRVYRLGQLKSVHVYLPILRDASGALARSFDEAVDDVLSSKQSLATDFLAPLATEDSLGAEVFSQMADGGGRTLDSR